MGYPIRQYICLVDCHRRPSRRRNTYGRYQVGAKTPKEARRILQQKIGFGAVNVCCEEKEPLIVLKRGEAVRELYVDGQTKHVPVHHATEQQPQMNNE